MGEIIVAVFGIYLILQMIIGYRRGLIKSMLNLASWILTFAIAYKGAAYFKEIVFKMYQKSRERLLQIELHI